MKRSLIGRDALAAARAVASSVWSLTLVPLNLKPPFTSGWFWNRARSYVTSFGAKCETLHLSRPEKSTYSQCMCISERPVRRYESSEHYYEHSNGVTSSPNAIMADPNALPGVAKTLWKR